MKKVPAKAATMVADEYEAHRMDTGEKSVKFSSTDEILEIESRRTQAIARANRNRLNKTIDVRDRLGATQNEQPPITKNILLHRTKKIIKLKQPVKRANGQTLKVSPLKSDEIHKPIKSRLTFKKGIIAPELSKLVNRIGRVSLSARLGVPKISNGNRNTSKSMKNNSSSVFDRLGFNSK